MARITICDLCKQQIKKDEAGPFGLGLSRPEPVGIVEMEVCGICATLLIELFESDEPPAAFLKNEVKEVRTRSTLTLPASPAAPLEFSEPVGPTAAEKAKRQPTDELLEDEINKVPSAVNHTKGSRELAEKWAEEDRQKGCEHHFKTFEDGKIICADAPKGMRGKHSSFKGCGKRLGMGEV